MPSIDSTCQVPVILAFTFTTLRNAALGIVNPPQSLHPAAGAGAPQPLEVTKTVIQLLDGGTPPLASDSSDSRGMSVVVGFVHT